MSWLSSIVNTVTSTVSNVVKNVVVKPISWIGDTLSDTGDWVVDEIIEPVVDGVDDVAEAIQDDPVKAVATVAAYTTGNAWAIPLIEGVDVAQNGGDIGDILEASATAYVAQQAGSYAGKYASEAALSASANQTAATILGTASGQAASAAVTGQDPVEAFLRGGLQAGVDAGLGFIDEKVTKLTDDAADSIAGTGTVTGTTSENIGAVAETESFLDKYPTVKNVLAKSLEATLSGGNVTGEIVMGAVVKGKLTKELVQDYLTTENFDPEDPSDQRYLAALTTTVQNVTNATFSGADVSDTLYASANAYGRQELNKIVDKEIKNSIDKVTGDYQKVEAKATELDTANATYTQTAQEYNGYVAELQSRISVRDEKLAEVNRLREELRTSFGNTIEEGERAAYQTALDNYNAAVADFNDYSATVDAYYEDTYKPNTDALRTNLDSQEETINALVAEYDTLRDDLVSTGDQLDDELVPVTNAVQSAYVRAMTNDEFNAAEYKEVNKLGDISDDDARYHWLTTGKDEKLPVNKAQYNLEFNNALEESMQGTLEVLGLKVTDLTPEQIKLLREQTLAVGNDLSSIRDIKNGSFSVANELQNKIFEAEEYEDLREELIESYNVSTINDLPEEVKKETIKQINATEEKQKIIKPDNVSDVDILTGKATVTSNAEGLLEWGNISLRYDLPKWDSRYGTVTRTVPHPDIPQADATVDMQGRYLELDENGQPIPIVMITGFPRRITNDNLRENNAGQYLDTLADVTPEAVQEAVNAGVAGLQQQYEFAKNVATYIANTETAKNIANSDFGKNTAGVVLDAGGELLNSMNALVLIAGVNPESTPAGKLARDMITLAGDFKTEEYQEASARIQDTISKANFNEDGTLKTNPDGTPLSTSAKAWNTIKAIGTAIKTDPGVFASEYVAKEVLQEIPVLVASGGTGSVVKQALQQAGSEFAQTIGQRTALGTAAVLDVSESFGGTANSAYDEAYAVATKSGMSDAEAQEYAKDKAITAGTIAAVTTISTMGIGGNKFEKAILDGKGGKNFSEAFDVVAKEAAQEAVEEGFPTAYLESELYQLDPTRDVVGNVVGNSVLGALSGGSTAGSIYGGASTGDFLSNAIIAFNPEVRAVIQNENGLDAAGVTQQLTNLGISDNTVQANILNQVFDADYTSTGEAEQAAANYVTQNNVPYKFTQDELTQFAGSNADADIAALVDSFVDPRYLDTQEVIAAAEAEGITLTRQQAADYVGQKDEAQGAIDAISDLTSPITKADILQRNVDLSDLPIGASPEDVESIVNTAIADLPQSASPEDVNTAIDTAISGLENISSADVSTAINQALADRENLSTADVQNIVDTAISGLEDISVADVENVVDTAIANLPQSASPEDVSTAINTAISGLENISSADVSTAINNALADRENLSTTDVQGIVDSATTEFTQQIDTLETDLTTLINQNAGDVDAALEQLSTNLGTTEDALLTEIGTTRDALADQFTAQISDVETVLRDQIGDVESSLSDVITNVDTSLTDKISILENAGLTRDQAISEVSDKLDLSVADVQNQISDVETTLGDRIGDVETTLGDQINAAETSLTNVITDVNTSLTDKITTLENAGLTRDQAITEISNQLNVSVAEIQNQLAGIESGFDANILGLTSEVNAIADIIGKPATQVTPTDIDFIEDVIAQTAAFSGAEPFQFTQEQLQYDVTGDGIVDINDQNLLNDAIRGQDVTFATESKFQPATGIFAQLDQQAALQQQQQADIQAQIQAQLAAQAQQQADQQAQLAQQVEDEAIKTRRLDNIKDFQNMLRQDAGRITQVRSQPVAEIGPAYDFQSIFRDPKQQAFYRTPYAEGGVVDVNDELLRLIGGK